MIVMEYVRGESLGELVRNRGMLDDVAAARVWSSIAGALDAAHEQGVMHRDVKPGNIVFDGDGQAHLIDFGIARRTGDATLTATGFVLGTPDFLPPEVAAGSRRRCRPTRGSWRRPSASRCAASPRAAITWTRCRACVPRRWQPAHTPAAPLGAPGAAARRAGRRPGPAPAAAGRAPGIGRLAAVKSGTAGRAGDGGAGDGAGGSQQRAERHRTVAGQRSRLDGVDAARAVALAGMASVHILPVMTPASVETIPGWSRRAGRRRCSRCSPGSGSRWARAVRAARRWPRARGAGAGLVVRGALVAVVGLSLVGLKSPVAVILAYYGLLFVLAMPLLRLPPRARRRGAVWCVAGPVLSHVLRAGRRAWPGEQPGFAALGAACRLLRKLALTGYYPVLPWLTYLLAGMAVGRLDLRRARVAVGLLGGGAGLAVAASVASAVLLGPGGGAAVIGADLAERRYGTRPDRHLVVARGRGPALRYPVGPRPHHRHRTGGARADAAGGPCVPALVWPPAAAGRCR